MSVDEVEKSLGIKRFRSSNEEYLERDIDRWFEQKRRTITHLQVVYASWWWHAFVLYEEEYG